MSPEIAQAITAAVLAFLALIQAQVNWKISRIEAEIYRANLNLDQTLQRLYRARDLIIEIHKLYADVFIKQDFSTVERKEIVALLINQEPLTAELRGLSLAIGDDKLETGIEYFIAEIIPKLGTTEEETDRNYVELRTTITLIHFRMYEILAEKTSPQTHKKTGWSKNAKGAP